MTRDNELYEVGEVVLHRIFGRGVVTDYVHVSDSEKEYNRVGIRFEGEGHKWLIAAPGYLSRTVSSSTPALFPDSGNPLVIETAIEQSSSKSREIEHDQKKPAATPRRNILKLFASILAGGASLAVIKRPNTNRARMLPVLETRIAGFAYYQGEQCLARIKPGDRLELKRESANRHDGKAIEVFWRGHKLGYVPRSHNAALSQLLDQGERIDVVVKDLVERQWEPLEFKVGIWV